MRAPCSGDVSTSAPPLLRGRVDWVVPFSLGLGVNLGENVVQEVAVVDLRVQACRRVPPGFGLSIQGPEEGSCVMFIDFCITQL